MNHRINLARVLLTAALWNCDRERAPMKTELHCKEAADISSDLEVTLTELEQGLLRLGRVQVNADAASRGRDAVASLAARGLMRTWIVREGASVICGEITEAGRIALAWASDDNSAGLFH